MLTERERERGRNVLSLGYKCKPLNLDAGRWQWSFQKWLGCNWRTFFQWIAVVRGDMIDWLICCARPFGRGGCSQGGDRGGESSVSQWVPWISQPLTSLVCRVSFAHWRCKLRERTNEARFGIDYCLIRVWLSWNCDDSKFTKNPETKWRAPCHAYLFNFPLRDWKI